MKQKYILDSLSTKPKESQSKSLGVGVPVGIMVSEEEYESMKHFYANRLLHSLDDAGKEAEEKLQELLIDES